MALLWHLDILCAAKIFSFPSAMCIRTHMCDHFVIREIHPYLYTPNRTVVQGIMMLYIGLRRLKGETIPRVSFKAKRGISFTSKNMKHLKEATGGLTYLCMNYVLGRSLLTFKSIDFKISTSPVKFADGLYRSALSCTFTTSTVIRTHTKKSNH